MVARIKRDIFVYAEGGGGGKENAALQGEFREALSAFFSKTALGTSRRPRVVACGGRERAYDRFCTALREGKNALLLVDSEAPIDPAHQPKGFENAQPEDWKPWEHLAAQAGWTAPEGANKEDCHLMVEVMESWFLADADAVSEFFGKGFKTKALPEKPVETISKAEVYNVLETATKECPKKGCYGKGAHSFELLCRIDPTKVQAAAPWAKRFIDELCRRKP